MSMWRCEYCGEWNDFSKQHECPELPRLKALVAELEDWKETAITNSDCPDGHDPIDHFSTLATRVAELEHQLDELHRRELKANPEWVQLRTLKSGAVCDGQCGGEDGEPCWTCKADAEWSARVAELQTELDREQCKTLRLNRYLASQKRTIEEFEASRALERDDRVDWISLRLRNLAKDFEERYRPLDEEVPKTKQP